MIKLFSLEKQNKSLANRLDKAIAQVIKSGVFILGKKVAEFENAFAKYLGVKYAIGLASGTDALLLSLLAFDIGRGDEVIMPANAYPTAFAVAAAGAVPKLVDIDPSTYNIDAKKIEKTISNRTKAIVAVHLYGQIADMVAIGKLSKKYSIPIIEDCSQAHGAEIRVANYKSQGENDKWVKAGSIGDIGCFSFYPTKNLSCFGDGGMAVTNNSKLARKIRLLRMYGEESRYQSLIVGRNSRLDELQAAILLVKLSYLDRWNKKRREIAKQYRSQYFCFFHRLNPNLKIQAKNRTLDNNLQFPLEMEYARHIFHLFVIRTKKRDELKSYLAKKGVQTAIHYPSPVHLQPSFSYLGYKKGDFPQAESACREILSLPMYPELTRKQISYVAKTTAEFFGKSR